MGVETSAIEIRINVTDMNSAAAVGSVTKEFDRLGAAGVTAGGRMRQGLGEAGTGAGESLHKVHLFTEEFGVHMPRAFQHLVAESKLAQAALGALTPMMMGLAGIQIGGMLFEAASKGAREMWNEMTGLSKAAKDYAEEVEKTRQQEFGNTHSIETTTQRIDEVTEAIKRMREQQEGAQKFTVGWRTLANVVPGLGNYLQGEHHREGFEKPIADQQRILDTLQRVGVADKVHQQRSGDIEIWAAQRQSDIHKMPEVGQASAQRDFQIEEATRRAHEERRYGTEQDQALGHHTPADAGADEEARTIATARIKANDEFATAQKKTGDDGKSQALELVRIHEEALESGLRGSQLYHAQESAAIEDLKRRGIATAQAVGDIHTKYHNEEMKQLQEQQRETEKLRGQAAMAGQSGIARARSEGADRTADLDPNLDLAERAKRVGYIDQETNAKIAEQKRTLTEEVDALADRSATRQISGFGRINAEASKQLDELKKKIEATYGAIPRIGPLSVDQAQGKALQQRGEAGIGAGAQEQSGDLSKKYAQETEQLEEQARVKLLSSEKQKTAGIQDEYRERLQKYQEWKTSELSSDKLSTDQRAAIEDNYNRRVAAAGMEANGEMVQAATEARQKMADEFDTLFKGMDHPLKMLEGLGDKVAGQAAAALVQRMQQGHGGAGTAAPGSSGVGILDTMMGGFGFGGHKTAGAGAIPGAVSTGAHGTGSVASAMFSVSTATINVGGASFGGGGASTGMLAAGSSGASGGFGGGFSGGSGGGGSFGGGTYGSGDFVAGYSGGGAYSGGASASGGGPGAYVGGGGASGGATSASGRGGGIVGDLSSGMGLFNQGKGIFGQGGGKSVFGAKGQQINDSLDTQTPDLSGKINSDGSFSSAGSTNAGMLGGGGFGANAMGAAGGALGMFSAFEGTGGFGGALKGGMAGMQLGMSLGGPLGAAIGAGAGAIVGAIGFGGREQARVYDLKTIRPKLTSDQDAYAQGGMDYMTAYSDVQGMIGTSWATTKKMGPAAESYWGDTIKPELLQAMAKFTSEQRAGRSMYTAQAASYATGTPYVPETGMNQNHAGERIFSSVENREITRAVVDGNGGKMPVQSGVAWSGDINLHAIDTQSGVNFLMNNKHVIRGAINESLAENSGGGL
jgi:hypothetical protein